MVLCRQTKELMKWVVILPIFIIFAIRIVDALLLSNYTTTSIYSYEEVKALQIESICNSLILCSVAFAFFAICFIFKHCTYTWIITIAFVLHEITGLFYSIFIFDYNLYLTIIYSISAVGVGSLAIAILLNIIKKKSICGKI